MAISQAVNNTLTVPAPIHDFGAAVTYELGHDEVELRYFGFVTGRMLVNDSQGQYKWEYVVEGYYATRNGVRINYHDEDCVEEKRLTTW